MKKLTLILWLLSTTICTFAYHFKSGDLYYNITSDSTVEVTYQEILSYNNYAGLISAIIPESVTYNGTTYSVTSIGEGAFCFCRGLISVTIGNSVMSIGENAFSSCCGLTSITIPDGVTSIGDRAFYGCGGLTSITIPNSVTSIGDDAFSGCSGLTSVTIPNSVTSIGGEAFSGCSGLTSITIPHSVTNIGESTFSSCSGLTSVTIPNSVTSIGDRAFLGCSGLTSITIPNSVTSIGEGAFYGCSGLASVTLSNSITSIGYGTFLGCSGLTSVTIPNSVTSIGGEAFYGCSGLTSVTISNSLTSIGYGTFSGCSGLTSVTIPNSVTSIGESAFSNCTGLMSIAIPNSVKNIGEYAFGAVPNIVYSGTAEGAPWGARCMNGYVDGYLVYSDATKTTLIACSSAATGIITVPNSVTSIGKSAFWNCSRLTSVTVESGNSVYDSRNNCNAIIETATNTLIVGCQNTTIPNSITSIGEYAFYRSKGLTSVTIPNGVTSIGENAFYGCSGLTSITIPNSVMSIGGWAFLGCSGLTSITIPNSVTSIGECAFYGCRSLISVTIPSSIKSIATSLFSVCMGLTSVIISDGITSVGDGAFSSCTGLTYITCYATEPPSVSSDAFYGVKVDTIPLYVPMESVTKYQSSDVWKDFLVLPISAMPADTDEPVLNPEENRVTITWPATDSAATYIIEISKDGAPVRTLTFDANGVLKNMRFAAPSRHAAQHTTQAEATGSGFRFVVEGLDSATTYAYTITATDIDNAVLTAYTGLFTTTGDNPTTDTEDIRSAQSQPETRKVIRNGQMYIIRGEKTYTATGGQL